ncbi:MAG: hypothetical protein A2078_14090 [Nitrospirae bacterium GWC2_57_9]|nr:MAG: hypothetical protein A2078_14090 [Nitrospirae bacterium GWC2_57_9]
MKHLAMAARFSLVMFLFLIPGTAKAHCDTLDGPVVATAKAALEKGELTPILKWVKKENETEIRDLFKKTVVVRSKGKDAQELADRYFFETLVRIHRAGEGAPYTGLKPAGQVEPSIAAADKAIESGSVDNLVKMINDAAASGIRQRYTAVRETRKHADESVEAGRKYVEAYVDFTHYVEALDLAAASAAHHEKAQKSPKKHEDHKVH